MENYNLPNQEISDHHENEIKRLHTLRRLQQLKDDFAQASHIKTRYNELYEKTLTDPNPPKEELKSLYQEWESEIQKISTALEELHVDSHGVDTMESIDSAITILRQGGNL